MKYISRFLIAFGSIFIVLALILVLIIFFPVVKEEANYQLITKRANSQELTPVNKEFGLVIPKIQANSKIIKNVDPFDSNVYQQALSKGVAHAKGSGFPGEDNNTFLFSHSSDNLLEASRYNSVFYLINKLEKDDDIFLFYNFDKIPYKVTEKKIIDATEVNYLNLNTGTEQLTLMTCWPAGTTHKRLLVLAEPAELKEN